MLSSLCMLSKEKKSLPDTKSQRYSPAFSGRSFIDLVLALHLQFSQIKIYV